MREDIPTPRRRLRLENDVLSGPAPRRGTGGNHKDGSEPENGEGVNQAETCPCVEPRSRGGDPRGRKFDFRFGSLFVPSRYALVVLLSYCSFYKYCFAPWVCFERSLSRSEDIKRGGCHSELRAFHHFICEPGVVVPRKDRVEGDRLSVHMLGVYRLAQSTDLNYTENL